MRRRRKRSSKIPQLTPLLLLLLFSLCLNIYFLVTPDLFAAVGEKLSLQEMQELKEPGIYGPEGIEVVEGSLYICAPGITLQNALIKGDLFLTEAIGEGSAALRGVSVKGTARIEGGGEETVIIEDATINHLVIERKEGLVCVLLRGDTVIEKVTLKGEAALSTAGLSKRGAVGEICLEAGAQAELEGSYDLVSIVAKGVRIALDKGRVKKLAVGPEAEEAVISPGKDALIALLEAGAPLTLTGEGRVKKVIVEAPGLFKFFANIDELSACGRGIFLEFDAGDIAKLLVKESPGKVMVRLAGGASIKNIVLDGAAGITGGGTIGSVKINKTGSSIEQKPGSVELALGITAEVAGETLKKVEKKPEPPPVPAPATSSPGSTPKAPAGPTFSFTLQNGLTPGNKTVIIKLDKPDPQNYTVTVGKTTLKYRSDQKVFQGEVPESNAKQSNVRVTRN